MDPAEIIGLTAAIQQILSSVYKFGQGVRESKIEINQLCSELLALKASLEHVQLNLLSKTASNDLEEKEAHLLLTSDNLSTPECQDMLASAKNILGELLTRLEVNPGRLKASLQKLTWPLMKDDVKRYVDRLHRLSSWFVLTTTSDNL